MTHAFLEKIFKRINKYMSNTLEQNKIEQYIEDVEFAWNKVKDGDLATKLFSFLEIENDNLAWTQRELAYFQSLRGE
jgi:hypothetical protein